MSKSARKRAAKKAKAANAREEVALPSGSSPPAATAAGASRGEANPAGGMDAEAAQQAVPEVPQGELMRQMQATLEVVQGKLAALDTECTELRKEWTAQQNEISALENEISAQQNEISALNHRVTKLEVCTQADCTGFEEWS